MALPSRRVVVTTPTFDDEALAFLRENGLDVDPPSGLSDGAMAASDLVDRLRDADGWIVGQAHVTREVIERLPRLKVLSRRGVGYERVDLEAARQAGLVVTIAAGGNNESVADHALGLILSVLRRLRETQKDMESGKWSILASHDLYGKTVGIVGLGRVGSSVVKRLKGFDCRVLVNTRTPDAQAAERDGFSHVDLETLLRTSDVISIHTPLVPETQFMIDARAIAMMKPSAIVVNVGRGGVVNDRDLLEALRSKRILGAGLDVFASESLPDFADVTRDLIALPNVVASPHAAASSVESLMRTNMLAAKAVVAVLGGGAVPADQIVADGRSALPVA